MGHVQGDARTRARPRRGRHPERLQSLPLSAGGHAHPTLVPLPQVPATPGQGTLFMRNPPAPTHRVKYILNYGRLGYEPMIGPSHTGPMLPGEVQYRPSLPDYDVKPDANPYVTYEDQQKERHSHHHEKLPEPSQ